MCVCVSECLSVCLSVCLCLSLCLPPCFSARLCLWRLGAGRAPQVTPDKRKAVADDGSDSPSETPYKGLAQATREDSDVEITGAWLAEESPPAPAFVAEAAARARRAPPVSPAENAWKPSDDDPRVPVGSSVGRRRRARTRVSKKRRVLKRPAAPPSAVGRRTLDHKVWREANADVLAEIPPELHPAVGRRGPRPRTRTPGFQVGWPLGPEGFGGGVCDFNPRAAFSVSTAIHRDTFSLALRVPRTHPHVLRP